MVVSVSARHCTQLPPPVPYAIPVRISSVPLHWRIAARAVATRRRGWPCTVACAAAVLLAFIAFTGLTLLCRHPVDVQGALEPTRMIPSAAELPPLRAVALVAQTPAPPAPDHDAPQPPTADSSQTPNDSGRQQTSDSSALEPIREPLTPAPLPLERGEGTGFSDRHLGTSSTVEHAASGDSAEKPSELAPPTSLPLQRETVIQATAISGSPVGVGRIELLFGEDQLPVWHPDMPLVVDDVQHRIRFSAVDAISRKMNEGAPVGIRLAEVYFLFLGREPLTIRMASPVSTWVESYTIQPRNEHDDYRDMLSRWRAAYHRSAMDLSGPAGFLRQLTLRVLSRRLGLGDEPFPAGVLKERPMAELEKSFEHSLSTLLGIDSLLLAVPEVTEVDAAQWNERSNLPVPSPLNLPAVQVPTPRHDAPLERLAMYVPQDCFYARCQRASHLTWLREFTTAWGGNLHNIVALPPLDYAVRARLEEQLALSLQRSETLGIDNTIVDMALIGADFFFQEGAAVGVVLQSQDAPRLRKMLLQQCADVQRRHAAAERTTLTIGRYRVDALSSKDNSLRSFYVVKDDVHFVTNSMGLLQQFLAIDHGRGSLGQLPEYRYAQSGDRSDASSRSDLPV